MSDNGTNEIRRLYCLAELTSDMQDCPDPSIGGLRHMSKDDAADLGNLLFHAYRGTVDDEGETVEDAIGEAQKTIDSYYGKVVWPASYVIERNAAFISAIIVTNWPREEDFLLAFSVTRPPFRNRGYATELIRLAQRELYKLGAREMALFVNELNDKAISIYRKTGFRQSEFHMPGK